MTLPILQEPELLHSQWAIDNEESPPDKEESPPEADRRGFPLPVWPTGRSHTVTRRLDQSPDTSLS